MFEIAYHDLPAFSRQMALAIAFPESRSASYDAAVNVASQADAHSTAVIGRTRFHLCGFGRNRAQASLALALCGYVRSIKGVQYYGGGKLLLGWVAVESVLLCYLEATACDDFRAHCYRTLDEDQMYRRPARGNSMSVYVNQEPSADGQKPLFLLPCTYLLKNQFGIDPDHPSTPQDQIQAAGIERGCDWCPNFNPKELKQL